MENKATLFQIESELLELDQAIQSQDGEVSTEDETKMAELISSSKNKVSSFCYILDQKEAEIKMCKEIIKRAEEHVESLKKAQERRLNYASRAIELRGESLAGNFGNLISTRKSTSVEVTCEPHDLPIQFQRVTVSADKNLLKEKLKSGESIEGVCLIKKNGVTWR